jgi:high affinity Mn2+ porin
MLRGSVLRHFFSYGTAFLVLVRPLLVQADQIVPSPVASPIPSAAPDAAQRWSIHGQATNTQQYHGRFDAPYSGPQSLSNRPDTAKTFDATLFLGARIGKTTELYINPELDQGYGLGSPGNLGSSYNGTFGAAGFVSGEAYKVGRDIPYMRVQRVFVRQTFNQGGAVHNVEPDINQLGGSVTAKHITITAGKFAVTDVFDNNTYAHDPKNDFLNWTMIDMGAFDYAAVLYQWGFQWMVPRFTARMILLLLATSTMGYQRVHKNILRAAA